MSAHRPGEGAAKTGVSVVELLLAGWLLITLVWYHAIQLRWLLGGK